MPYALISPAPLHATVASPPVAVMAPAESARSTPGCIDRVSDDATVVLLGMIGGKGAPAPLSLAGGSWLGDAHPTHTVAVTGRATGKVVLVVAAYEPTVWDLTAVRDRVEAVIAYGSYPQAVAGLRKTTPIRFASTFTRGPVRPRACGWVRYATQTTSDIERMANAVGRTLGTHPRRFYGGRAPTNFDIDGGMPADPPHAPALSAITAGVAVDAAPVQAGGSAPTRDGDADALVPARRIVEWDPEGAIIRDEGGGAVRPSYAETPRAFQPYRPRPRYWPTPGGVLILLGALALWLWRRKNPIAPSQPEHDAAPPPAPVPAAPPPAFPEPQIAELSRLAAMTGSEPLVVALHRYGRELRMVSRISFDPDLANEANAIVERHFEHAIARYRQVRAGLDGADAERADDTLRRALERLGSRLRELHEEQQHRDVDGIDQAARFIDYRHPKA